MENRIYKKDSPAVQTLVLNQYEGQSKQHYILNLALALLMAILCSCNGQQNSTSDQATTAGQSAKSEELYFNYSIDGKEISLDSNDILTTYNEFSASDREFKIFAGKEAGPNLLLTLVADMSKPSSTANGSPNAGDKLGQGSVSLQNYPTKGLTFNSYDFLLNPKPAVIPDAIVITSSEKIGEIGRIISGTINVTVRGGENKQNDPAIKDYVIKGKFRIKHEFKGLQF